MKTFYTVRPLSKLQEGEFYINLGKYSLAPTSYSPEDLVNRVQQAHGWAKETSSEVVILTPIGPTSVWEAWSLIQGGQSVW